MSVDEELDVLATFGKSIPKKLIRFMVHLNNSEDKTALSRFIETFWGPVLKNPELDQWDEKPKTETVII